jgi:DNA-directed RNA polymerase subunit L
MAPQVKFASSNNKDILGFTLSGVNVSIANAVRRTMLADIPTLVFRTSPYEENKANFVVNTTRLNNEILKQRLSCIPIHVNDIENFPYKNYIMELNMENTTDTTIIVTSKDFVVKDKVSGQPVSEQVNREIFPANEYGYYIDFVRLRPKVSAEIPGDKIQLTCEFSIGTAKEDGSFSVVSTCAYGFTVDEDEQKKVLDQKKLTWKHDGKTQDQIDFEVKNWLLLDGLRIAKPDSFDFSLQSIGVYTNKELLDKACSILVDRMTDLDTLIVNDKLKIVTAQNTMENCYDIILEQDDYTIGKTIEYFLYSKYYKVDEDKRILTFCGYKKMHPHDDEGIIRVAYKQNVDKVVIYGHLQECIRDSIAVFGDLKKKFSARG